MNRDDKDGWRPRRVLDPAEARTLAARAFPRDRVLAAEPLHGGLRNTSIRVALEGRAERSVLRLYDADPAACGKEAALLSSLAPTVPVPELLEARPLAADGLPPLLVLRYVEGITFRDLKNAGNAAATAQAAASVGATLAAIGHHRYPRAGRLEAGGKLGAPFVPGPDPFLRFFEHCLAMPALQARMDVGLRERVAAYARAWAPRLRALDDDARLVHGDFGATNILVHQVRGAWQVAAVIDWEFALAGSPMFDLGHFLRYERAARPVREPTFSQAYRDAGGELPDDWRQVARAVDLTALCDLLTRDEVPREIVDEVTAMVEASLAGRDAP
jgi:aminoglycoside phosphotransferase (APT) family kinase protein